MTKEELIKWAESKGWELDKWGHLKKKDNPNIRIKLGTNSVRFEFKNGNRWFRRSSNYYKHLSISEKGKLQGLKRGF
jgi:hypothetical protein